MTRGLVAAGLALWVGAALLLSNTRRLSRPSLADRLAPYHPVRARAVRRRGVSMASVAGMFGPIARDVGDTIAKLFGAVERVDARLRRIHSPLDATAFRLRQLAWSGAALLAALAVSATGVPLPVALLLVVGAPLLAFLVAEQRLATASTRWQEQIRLELPVVSEQFAMLLGAGYSLGAAVNRLAERGRGCCARDLTVVANRIRQGLSERDALREWAQTAGVDALDRLVDVLVVTPEGGDLARLISAEARQCRRDLHRRTVEVLERRAQQVWVPVTVATLVPGVIFLAIPFLAALRLFANT